MFKIALMIFLYIFCKFIGIICILRDALSEIKNIKIVVKMIKNLVIKLWLELKKLVIVNILCFMKKFF